MLKEYRKRYETPFPKGDHSIIKNRIRETYLNNVDDKILSMELEKNAILEAKDGLEVAIYHTTFNSHSPFSFGRDGEYSPMSLRVDLLPRYEDVLAMNINLAEKFTVPTYPRFIDWETVGGELKSRFLECFTYLLPFTVEEALIEEFPLKPAEDWVIKHMKDKEKRHFFEILPSLCSTSEGGSLRHVYKFKTRLC